MEKKATESSQVKTQVWFSSKTVKMGFHYEHKRSGKFMGGICNVLISVLASADFLWEMISTLNDLNLF